LECGAQRHGRGRKRSPRLLGCVLLRHSDLGSGHGEHLVHYRVFRVAATRDGLHGRRIEATILDEAVIDMDPT
jgi:hypothetical protein